MPVTLTPVVYVMRAGPEHKVFGEPYSFVATVLVHEKTAYIQGAKNGMDIKVAREVYIALKKEGIKKAVWTRTKNKSAKESVFKERK